MFAKFFDSKIQNIVHENKPSNTAYLGKRKIIGQYEENWITTESVKEVIMGLQAK